ncbi:Phosphotransferase enzyme family protein [Ruania alba]|uniref:Phosphotransferase enzyme family protein n=2 Tax=Ruania alba TaxID=648782 RepID=A0A1H5FZY2_9MICO|nr:Phosphotransferase enzyme family protein [Ruania alba]
MAHRIISSLGLPWATPEPIGEEHSASGRTGLRLTFVAGATGQAGWPDVGNQLVQALTALHQVQPRQVEALSSPRAWCGGHDWSGIVQQRLVPRLPPTARTLAVAVVEDVLAVETGAPARLVHGDFGMHNILWDGQEITGVIDWDHAAWGDPAIDIAPLIGTFGAADLRSAFEPAILERALVHRATLPLQVAAAATIVGNRALCDHALRNFCTRSEAGTLYDPGGLTPPDARPKRAARSIARSARSGGSSTSNS